MQIVLESQFCPATIHQLAQFELTWSSAHHETEGICVKGAVATDKSYALCGSGGEWDWEDSGSFCECEQGKEPNVNRTACQGQKLKIFNCVTALKA